MSRVLLVRVSGHSTSPTACALAVRRCALWGWRKGVPGGGAFRRCVGRLRSGAPPSPAARPLGGLSGSATHVLWSAVCGRGGPALSPWLACPVGAACRRGGRGAVPGGGDLPPLSGASGVRRCPSPGRPSSGAGRRGSATRVSRGAVGVAVGTQHRPHSMRPWGPELRAVGLVEGRPRGGCLALLCPASEVRRFPSPDCPPSGRSFRVRYPRAVSAGVRVWGPSTVSSACMPFPSCVPQGGGGGPSPGGGLACNRCKGRLV